MLPDLCHVYYLAEFFNKVICIILLTCWVINMSRYKWAVYIYLLGIHCSLMFKVWCKWLCADFIFMFMMEWSGELIVLTSQDSEYCFFHISHVLLVTFTRSASEFVRTFRDIMFKCYQQHLFVIVFIFIWCQ
jgi:hypothetical protein